MDGFLCSIPLFFSPSFLVKAAVRDKRSGAGSDTGHGSSSTGTSNCCIKWFYVARKTRDQLNYKSQSSRLVPALSCMIISCGCFFGLFSHFYENVWPQGLVVNFSFPTWGMTVRLAHLYLELRNVCDLADFFPFGSGDKRCLQSIHV
ncbi:hypothetical protein CSUI_002547 [Cystoisospora suis]|uniref:Uncharacterized protein n=1 Tax=Cystoisospora suis TaxID=483139 RepID=A0A2C6L8U9_9APIC|nr:hypothetical protein CSUI_002547 [Cystoisospora suis]